MKKLILLLLLIKSSLVIAQNFVLEGRVFDKFTSDPLPEALVFISSNHFDYTNYKGFYSIKNLVAGNYQIKISLLGYKYFEAEIQVNSDNVVKNFYLQPSPIQLENVVVTIDRNTQLVRNSPYSTAILSKQEIQQKPSNSIPENLKNISGISIMRDGIWGNEINIRGLSRENIVTLIDGNRIVTSTDISARLSMIDINDIERVEIIKGASSNIYGSGATGGIVNIISKSPNFYDKFSLNGKFGVEYNSVNNLKVFSTNLYSGTSYLSGKISGSFRKAYNTKTPAGYLKNSQFEDFSLSTAVNFLPLTDHLIKLNYQLFKANNVGIPGSSLFTDIADVRYPIEKRELIFAAYDIDNLSKIIYKVSLKYSHQYIKRKVENIPYTVQNIPASGNNPPRRIRVLKIEPEADHFNNNIQLYTKLLIANKLNFITGVDYWDRKYNGFRQRFQKIEVLNNAGAVDSTIDRIIAEKPLPDSKMKSIGLFLQGDSEIIKNKLLLFNGFRYDFISIEGSKTLNPLYEINNGILNSKPANQKVLWTERKAKDNSFSGNLGLKYSAFSDLDFTLNSAYAFRSPSLEERFQFIDLGSFVRVGNPDLKSEISKSVDLGIRYYSKNISINSSIFYNRFDNLVSEISGTFDGRPARIRTNIGDARLYGFEFGCEFNFFLNNVFYLNVAYVKGDDLTFDPHSHLPQIPPLNGLIGYRNRLIDLLNIDLSLTVYSKQNKVAIGEPTTPGYGIVNFFLNSTTVKFYNTKIRLFAGVENLFNKTYVDHLSSIRGLVKLEPGRNIFIKLALEF